MNYYNLLRTNLVRMFVLVLVLLTTLPVNTWADSHTKQASATMPKGLLKRGKLLFTENLGQITDMAGRSRNDVRFTANSGSIQQRASN